MTGEDLDYSFELSEIQDNTGLLEGSRKFLENDLKDKQESGGGLSVEEIYENKSQMFYHMRLKCNYDSVIGISGIALDDLKKEIEAKSQGKLDDKKLSIIEQKIEKEKQIDERIRQSLWGFGTALSIAGNEDRKDIEIPKDFEDAFIEAYRKIHDTRFNDTIYENLNGKEGILLNSNMLEEIIILVFERLGKDKVEELLKIDNPDKYFDREKKDDKKLDIEAFGTSGTKIYRVNLNYYYEKIFLGKDRDMDSNDDSQLTNDLRLFLELKTPDSRYKSIIEILEKYHLLNDSIDKLIDSNVLSIRIQGFIDKDKLIEIKNNIKKNFIIALAFIISMESDFENAKNGRTSAKGYFQFLNGIKGGISNIESYSSSSVNNPYTFIKGNPKHCSFITAINRTINIGDSIFPKEFIDKLKQIKNDYTESDLYGDPRSLNGVEQSLLLLGDFFGRLSEMNGEPAKSLLGNILLFGNQDSLREIYIKLHHTNPDDATMNRIDGGILPPQVGKINIYGPLLTSFTTKESFSVIINNMIETGEEKELKYIFSILGYPRNIRFQEYDFNKALKEFQEDFGINDKDGLGSKTRNILKQEMNRHFANNNLEDTYNSIFGENNILRQKERLESDLEKLSFREGIKSGNYMVKFLQRSLVIIGFKGTNGKKNEEYRTLENYPDSYVLGGITISAVKQLQETIGMDDKSDGYGKLTEDTLRSIYDKVSEILRGIDSREKVKEFYDYFYGNSYTHIPSL